MWRTVNASLEEQRREFAQQEESDVDSERRLQVLYDSLASRQGELQRLEVEAAALRGRIDTLRVHTTGRAIAVEESRWREVEQDLIKLMDEIGWTASEKERAFVTELRCAVARSLSIAREKMGEVDGAMHAAHCGAIAHPDDVGMWMRVMRLGRAMRSAEAITFVDKHRAVERSTLAYYAAQRIKEIRTERFNDESVTERLVGKAVMDELLEEMVIRSARAIPKFPQGPYCRIVACFQTGWIELGEVVVEALEKIRDERDPIGELAVTLDVRVAVCFVKEPSTRTRLMQQQQTMQPPTAQLSTMQPLTTPPSAVQLQTTQPLTMPPPMAQLSIAQPLTTSPPPMHVRTKQPLTTQLVPTKMSQPQTIDSPTTLQPTTPPPTTRPPKTQSSLTQLPVKSPSTPKRKRSISNEESSRRKSARQQKRQLDRAERENAEVAAAVVEATPSLRLAAKLEDFMRAHQKEESTVANAAHQIHCGWFDARLLPSSVDFDDAKDQPGANSLSDSDHEHFWHFHQKHCKGSFSAIDILCAWLEVHDNLGGGVMRTPRGRKVAHKAALLVDEYSHLSDKLLCLTMELCWWAGQQDEARQRCAEFSMGFMRTDTVEGLPEGLEEERRDFFVKWRTSIDDANLEIRWLWLSSYMKDGDDQEEWAKECLDALANKFFAQGGDHSRSVHVFYESKPICAETVAARRASIEATKRSRDTTAKLAELAVRAAAAEESGNSEHAAVVELWRELNTRIVVSIDNDDDSGFSLSRLQDIEAVIGETQSESALVVAAGTCADRYERADLCLQLAVASLQWLFAAEPDDTKRGQVRWVSRTLRDVLALANVEECVQALEPKLVDCVDDLARLGYSGRASDDSAYLLLSLQVAEFIDDGNHKATTARAAYLRAALDFVSGLVATDLLSKPPLSLLLRRALDDAASLVKVGIPCQTRNTLLGVLDLINHDDLERDVRASALALACELVERHGDSESAVEFAKEAHAHLAQLAACDAADAVFLKGRVVTLSKIKTRDAQLATAQCYCCLYGVKALAGAVESHFSRAHRDKTVQLHDLTLFLAPHVLGGRRDKRRSVWLVPLAHRREVLATLDFVCKRDPDLGSANKVDHNLVSYIYGDNDKNETFSWETPISTTEEYDEEDDYYVSAVGREAARLALAEMMISKLDARETTSPTSSSLAGHGGDPREAARLESVSWHMLALSFAPKRAELWASLGRCLDELANPLLTFGPMTGFEKHWPRPPGDSTQPYAQTAFWDAVAVHELAARIDGDAPWKRKPDFSDDWFASLAAAFADARRLAARRAHAAAAALATRPALKRSACLALACSLYDAWRELDWSGHQPATGLAAACADICRRAQQLVTNTEEDSPPYWFEEWLLGKLRWRARDSVAALAHFERAATSGHPDPVYRLARAKFKRGERSVDVIHAMRSCRKDDPLHARSALGLADALLQEESIDTDDAALSARRALEPLFERKRSQVVAVWRYENSQGLIRLDASPRKYDRLRLKYFKAYVDLLARTKDPERLRILYAYAATTKERSRCVATMLLIALDTRLSLVLAGTPQLELALNVYRDALKLADDPLFLEPTRADQAKTFLALADAALCKLAKEANLIDDADASAFKLAPRLAALLAASSASPPVPAVPSKKRPLSSFDSLKSSPADIFLPDGHSEEGSPALHPTAAMPSPVFTSSEPAIGHSPVAYSAPAPVASL